jgi:hypothetical protein
MKTKIFLIPQEMDPIKTLEERMFLNVISYLERKQ